MWPFLWQPHHRQQFIELQILTYKGALFQGFLHRVSVSRITYLLYNYIAAANQEGRSRLAMADPVGLPSTNRGDDDLISAKSH